MLDLNKVIDQLAIAKSARWHRRVSRIKGHVFTRALEFQVVDERKKWKKTEKDRWERNS